MFIAFSHPAAAQSFIRDTEIEADIRTMISPVWKAAGLDPDALHVYLIADRQINSFVAGGQNEFINTGLIRARQDAEPADRGAWRTRPAISLAAICRARSRR